jgi:(E)-4-hydroxy-3-methylbut-2-enyl-diphosphate synthase
MGCEVNGPGEAADADVGLASGRAQGLLFRKGVKLGKVPEREMVAALVREVEELAGGSEAQRGKEAKGAG